MSARRPGGGAGGAARVAEAHDCHFERRAWLAVNTIIEESTAWDVIPRLKEAKAQGIVEYPLNKVVM